MSPRSVRSVLRGRESWGFARALGAVALSLSIAACSTNIGDKECRATALGLQQRGVRLTGACEVEGSAVALRTLAEVLRDLPSEQTPGTLVVRIEPGRGGRAPRVEAYSRVLVVDPSSAGARDRTVWLHELAHVHARGSNGTRDVTTQRLRDAIEEGFADYFAAAAARSTTVGAMYGRGARDLTERKPPDASAWAVLPFAGAPFDEHDFGRALAATALATHGYDLALARAGLDALQRTSTGGARSPARLVDDLSTEGGGRASDLRALLSSWLPPELRHSQEILP